MTKPIKILLGAPISESKAYIIDEWLDYVRSLTWQALDVYLVDNSPTDTFANYVRSKGFEVDRVEPKGTREAFVAKCQNKIRDRFLEGDYDYLFSLECDNFCVPNVIEMLLIHRLDNINVPYFLKGSNETTIGVQVQKFTTGNYTRYDVMSPIESTVFMDGKIKANHFIPSIGCSLFSRRLMEQVKFRVVTDQAGKHSDSFFHHDSLKIGIQPYVDTSLFSTHKRNTAWSGVNA